MDKGEKIYDFLRPFYVITNLIFGTCYPTSNLYFMQVWNIECLLKANLENEDSVIKSMAMRMKVKFDKYLSDYSVVLALGAVLDLRMKLGTIKYCYSQLDLNTCQEKVDYIKSKLQMLFDEYSKSTSSTQPSESCSHSSFHLSFMTVRGKEKEHMDGFGAFDVSVCFLLKILHSLSLNLIL